MIRVGPAGWLYKDWAGIVYPEPRPKGFDPLEYLSGYFDTIEVNSTFYGPATTDTAAKWSERVRGRPDFRFTAKLWRRFTHQRKEAWTRAELAEARAAFDVLHEQGRLGAVLLQFPWSFRKSDESRGWLDDLIAGFGDLPLVVEVRHESWNDPAFFRELIERQVGFVNIDQPLFDDSIAPSATATATTGYIRVHGRNYRDWWRKSAAPHERYDYLYSASELEPWAERARAIEEEPVTDEVYVVTNNHYRGQAVTNALMLKSMIGRVEVEGPPGLFDPYGEALEGYAHHGS